MKRTGRRSRLRLDRPRGTVLRQFQQEAPIARAPTEERLSTSARRVPQVILAFWNARQQVGPLARHLELRIVWTLGQITERVPDRAIRLDLCTEQQVIAFAMPDFRKLKMLAIPARNNEHALTMLRHAVARRINHLPHRLIVAAGFRVDALDAIENTIESFALAFVGKAINILEQKGLGLRITQNAQVGRQRVGARIIQSSRIASRPIARLRERLTGRTAD